MTNAALVTIARNSPNLIRFRLSLIKPQTPDHLTLGLLDAGFGAVVDHCKGLWRLSLSGLLTDHVFHYIGAHAKKLEMLSVSFAGNSDLGLHYVLSSCESLCKLEIRDCPFGDKALLVNAARLGKIRYPWMSSCSVSYGTCKLLAQKLPRVNVEVIDERGHPDTRPKSCPLEKLYIYRTVTGWRFDMPDSIWTVDGDAAVISNQELLHGFCIRELQVTNAAVGSSSAQTCLICREQNRIANVLAREGASSECGIFEEPLILIVPQCT